MEKTRFFLMFLIVLGLIGCNNQADVPTLNLADLNIEVNDAYDVPFGTYEMTYTIEQLNDYIEAFNISVGITVVDHKNQEIPVTGDYFTVLENHVYTVTVSIFDADKTVLVMRTVTVTAVLSETDDDDQADPDDGDIDDDDQVDPDDGDIDDDDQIDPDDGDIDDDDQIDPDDGDIDDKDPIMTTLDVPQSVFIDNYGVLWFDAVDSADSYTILLNEVTLSTEDTFFDLSFYMLDNMEYTISVSATGNGFIESESSIMVFYSTRVENISLLSMPEQVDYVEGDIFNPEGMVVLAHYSDGRTGVLRHDNLSYRDDILTLLDQRIVVNHPLSGSSLFFDINVEYFDPAPTDVLDTPDLWMIDHYGYLWFSSVDDADTYVVSINGHHVQTSETFLDLTMHIQTDMDYNISVKAVGANYLDSQFSEVLFYSTRITEIFVGVNPTKMVYLEGEFFDSDGMLIECLYADNRTGFIENTDVNYRSELLTLLDQRIVFTHELSGLTTHIDIEVLPINQTWTVTFDGDQAALISGDLVQEVSHNGTAVAPEFDDKRRLFVGFDKTLENITEDTVIKAQWISFITGSENLTYEYSSYFGGMMVTGYYGTDTYVVIPEYYQDIPVVAIDSLTFFNNNRIELLYLPAGIKDLGLQTFQGATKLHTLLIDDNNPNFTSYQGLVYNKLMTELVFVPEGYKDVLDIPEGVVKIQYEAVARNQFIETIIVPDSLRYVESRAFIGSGWLNAHDDGIVMLGNILYTYKGPMEENTMLELEEGIVAIAGRAFASQPNLTVVEFPSTLEVIGAGAFSHCSMAIIVFPENIKSIGHQAFQYCENITNVYVPEGIEHFGYHVFSHTQWYTSLEDGPIYLGPVFYGIKGDIEPNTSLIIKTGTTVIADASLQYLNQPHNLTNIHMPNGLIRIGAGAFIGVHGLSRVFIPETVVEIGNTAFLNTHLDIHLRATEIHPQWHPNFNPDPREIILPGAYPTIEFTFAQVNGTTIIHDGFIDHFPESTLEYHFITGWYDNPEGDGEPFDLPFIPKSNIVLYPQYEKYSYTIEFIVPQFFTHVGGGDLVQTIEINEPIDNPPILIASDNHYFISWGPLGVATENTIIEPYVGSIYVTPTTITSGHVAIEYYFPVIVGAQYYRKSSHHDTFYVPANARFIETFGSNREIDFKIELPWNDEVFEIDTIVIDYIDRTIPSEPTFKYQYETQDRVLVTIVQGTIASGSSIAYNEYSYDQRTWAIFDTEEHVLRVPHGTHIYARTISEGGRSSITANTNVTLKRIDYNIIINGQLHPIQRYLVYEQISDGFEMRVNVYLAHITREGYILQDPEYFYRHYPDDYQGCGVHASHIYYLYLGRDFSTSFLRDTYVRTTNVLWIGKWIYTEPQWMVDGLDYFNDLWILQDTEIVRRRPRSNAAFADRIYEMLQWGFPVFLLSDDGDHWRVISGISFKIDILEGTRSSVYVVHHDLSGTSTTRLSALEPNFDDSFGSWVLRNTGWPDYKNTVIGMRLVDEPEE